MPDFENPSAFLFLLLLPTFFVLRKLKILKKASFPLTISDWNGKTFVWKSGILRFFDFAAAICEIFGFICFVCALANPIFRHREKIFISKGAEILFVLDISPSMASRDIAGMTRLEAAKVGIKTIANTNIGAAFGLVAMASEAAAIVPPTSDRELFLNRLDSLSAGTLGEGSAIGIGLSSAVYHSVTSSAPKKCIVLITDGENNAGAIHPETAALLAAENKITVYVFGIGTKGTVPIDYVDPNTGKTRSGYYESEFDTLQLERIAKMTNGKYFGIESTSALCATLSEIVQNENMIQTFSWKTNDENIYDLFLIFGAIFFAISWLSRKIILREVV